MNRTRFPRRRPLSPARIHRAALRIARARGVEDLSMRKLAAALGVDAMSIYHHVPNKRALLLGVYQAVLAELPLAPPARAAWKARLRQLGRRFYLLARKYPRIFPHLISSPYAIPREVEIYHRIRDILAAAGLGEDDAARTTRALYTYATGIAMVAVNARHPRPLYRHGSRRAPPAASGRRIDPERDLAFSIELIIAGIERRLAIMPRRDGRRARRRKPSAA